MQSRLGNSYRHDLQGMFLLRFCTFMIIMSQHYFFSFSFQTSIGLEKTRQDCAVVALLHLLSSTISRKVHLLVFSDLGVVAVEFCWAGLFYTYSSIQFPTRKSQSVQSFGVCSLGGAVVVSWLSVRLCGISDDTFKVLLLFDEFF